MLLSVFAIYDSGVSTWMPPLYARNKGEITRWFAEAVNDSKSKISKYPQDYTLFELGTWDDDKCKFSLHSTPISIGIAVEYVNRELVKPTDRLEDASEA